MTIPTWKAKYQGRCPICQDEIGLGDDVTWGGSGGEATVHVTCTGLSSTHQIETPVCPRCFQARSISGACGCDD